ncbi:ATP-binding protein [Paludibacterium yongneupense]|uniref:ATP-binding protein n=1 Tax=Paludibacterium yongneupense TaxID=400061 RepID=UPI0004097A35|nr:ATP-binding protein [Paludibacterium yongneupense]
MDGRSGRVGHSLQFRLSLYLSLTILVIAVVAGAISFHTAWREANEMQDDHLREVAELVSNLPASASRLHYRSDSGDADARLVVQPLPTPAEGGLALAADLPDGLHTVRVRHEAWRVYVGTVDGSRLAVAQPATVRDEIARDSAMRTLLPLGVLFPLLLLLVGGLVGRMFRPMRRLAADLDRRSEQDLGPVAAERLPSEVQPFVVAINRLLARVERSVGEQRRFVADAAHELRTPLTALSLQAENLAGTPLPTVAGERLSELRAGLGRTRTLLDQMLALARAQGQATVAVAPVSLQSSFRLVLEELMPLAQQKSIDLGVCGEADGQVAATPLDLYTLLKNLLDNAIRYTPERGRIDLSLAVTESGVTLRIDDSGPGIAPHERERVRDPFYRVLGSEQSGCGLGLSIVDTIARRIGATVTLGEAAGAADLGGLRVEVFFPAA